MCVLNGAGLVIVWSRSSPLDRVGGVPAIAIDFDL